MNDDDDGSNTVEDGIGMGPLGDGTPVTNTPPPLFGTSDPELAWWNGEPEGVEP